MNLIASSSLIPDIFQNQLHGLVYSMSLWVKDLADVKPLCDMTRMRVRFCLKDPSLLDDNAY